MKFPDYFSLICLPANFASCYTPASQIRTHTKKRKQKKKIRAFHFPFSGFEVYRGEEQGEISWDVGNAWVLTGGK